MQRAFELAGAHLIGVAAIAVLAVEERDRTTEIADVALDLGTQPDAPAADVITRGVADAFRRPPHRLVDPIAPFAFVLERRIGILQVARQRARARGDGFEHAALMLGQHLAELAAELITAGDAQEHVLDLLIGNDGIKHRVEGACLGPVKPELAGALARHVDDQLGRVRGQRAFVKKRQQGL